jgi:hypothetical protein
VAQFAASPPFPATVLYLSPGGNKFMLAMNEITSKFFPPCAIGLRPGFRKWIQPIRRIFPHGRGRVEVCRKFLHARQYKKSRAVASPLLSDGPTLFMSFEQRVYVAKHNLYFFYRSNRDSRRH